MSERLPQAVHEWSFEAIGTKWWIGLYDRAEAGRVAAAREAVARRIGEFDQAYSRFRDDSLVSEIARREGGRFELPDDSAALFGLYRRLYDATAGAVTPLVGRLLSDAGYDAAYGLAPGKLSAPPAWDEAMRFEDGVLTTTRPVLLDFGAAGKGYLVDLVAEVLRAAGFRAFCVDAGGDMVGAGLERPLKIGLENPYDPSQVIGVADLQTGALCGSAGNRRRWAGFHHIMDPHKLSSPEHVAAVWVTAPDGLTADGLATALFFAEPDKLDNFGFEYVILYANGTASASENFPGELFTERNTNK